MVLFCKDNKIQRNSPTNCLINSSSVHRSFYRRVMQLKQRLLVVCCFLHRSFTDSHGRCPCHSVLIRCSHHFVCCPLHRSITDSHGRCPCCSVFFRCFNNFIYCPLHRSITDIHGRCPCCSVLIRCSNSFICCPLQ